MIDEKEFKSRFVEEVNKGIDVIANIEAVVDLAKECWAAYTYNPCDTPEEWVEETRWIWNTWRKVGEWDNANRQEDG